MGNRCIPIHYARRYDLGAHICAVIGTRYANQTEDVRHDFERGQVHMEASGGATVLRFDGNGLVVVKPLHAAA